jgi:hypothetical protein
MTAHNHYFKPCPFDHVDAYRLILILNITDPCLQHAFKKIAFAGGRQHKSLEKDVQEAIDSLERWKAMRAEEAAAATPASTPGQRWKAAREAFGA